MRAQAKELAAQRVEMTSDELRAAAERERIRLEAPGEIDIVGDRLGVGADAAPSFDTLLGKTVEVRWRYWAKEDGKKKQAHACSPARLQSPCAPACNPSVSLALACNHCPSVCAGVYLVFRGSGRDIADGKTTKKSAKCKSPLPWGGVRIRWPEDREREEPESFV